MAEKEGGKKAAAADKSAEEKKAGADTQRVDDGELVDYEEIDKHAAGRPRPGWGT